MRLPVVIHDAHDPHRPHRVARPRHDLSSLLVFSPVVSGYGIIAGSRVDLLRLGALARFAAAARHTAVHLPIKHHRRPESMCGYFPDYHPVDILFIRLDLGLRPSAWVAVRRRIDKGPRRGRPAVVRAPAPRSLVTDRWPHWWHDDPRRMARLAEHGDTLVVTGPAPALMAAGDILTNAAEDTSHRRRQLRRHGVASVGTLTSMLRDEWRPPRLSNVDLDVFGLATWPRIPDREAR